MFVKVCGLRTPGDVDAAVTAGADAIGFVFAKSVRQVGFEQARDLAARAPAHVLTVGVFSGIDAEEAARLTVEAGLGALQLHGDYPRAAFTSVVGGPFQVIRATTLTPDTDVDPWGADMLLLDSPTAGSGERWDLSTLDTQRPAGRWLLAGGLRPDNIAAAIAAARPWGVDVSSGVESSRGVKDPGLIHAFLAAARAA
ncbi:phosphoribosylanthranilate isomerase [Actinokineospora globicatena]|uniref:N-(5'-phosphoribosyl)anthranilate isomerase n=1 Tax=Actinokineospora globicatena TaxID=103729 RepID=A0A9W6VA29_9PSEU|nr:phosphoribosylanthranilate isomerase [Actinokineospora globicatena]GLW95855.1 N-(5'-phosphoribosyl)anthranilate isomerase [Actinokineospora globicatena]